MLFLRDIAEAAEATGWVAIETFCALTHIRGRHNQHLAEPEGYDRPEGCTHRRTTPLPLDAEVHGRFITFDYCGHGTWATLKDHESLLDVGNSILSSSGILNFFTEVLLVFVDGKLREYEVRDESGRVLAKDGTRAVDRNELYAAKGARCRVVWSGG